MKRLLLILCLLLTGIALMAETLHFAGEIGNSREVAYGYWNISTLSHPVTVPSGAELVYEMRIPAISNYRTGGVELTGGSIGSLRDNGKIKDQNGLAVRGRGFPIGQWFERRFKLDAVTGKNFTKVDFFSAELSGGGRYEAEIRNIRLEIPGQPSRNLMTENYSSTRMRNINDCTKRLPVPLESGTFVIRSYNGTHRGNDFVVVKISPPKFQFDIPAGAFLCYDVKLTEHSVNPFCGIELTYNRGSLYHRQNGASAQRTAGGKWVSRKIDLSPSTGCRIIEVGAVAGFHVFSRSGNTEVAFRNIRIEDAEGKQLCDLTPKTGELEYPLSSYEQFAEKVTLEGGFLIGGRFRPAKYLTDSDYHQKGTIYLKNFDPARTQKVDYTLGWNGKVYASGVRELLPSQAVKIEVDIGKLQLGHHIPVLTLNGKSMTNYTVTILSPAELRRRPVPFSPTGFAMGIVPMSNSGGNIWNIPAAREQGMNFFQFRRSWDSIEPEQGKYDVNNLDEMLKMAEDCGFSVECEMYSDIGQSIPLPYRYKNAMVTNLGKKLSGNESPISYFSPGIEDGFKAMKAFYSFCLKSPSAAAFAGWIGGNLDAFMGLKFRKGHHREVMDYSSFARKAFQNYLRDECRYSLAEINRRYRIDCKSFDEIPLPTVPQVGKQPDLRPEWNDFCNFRLWSVEQIIRRSCADVRSYAPGKPVEFFYGGGLDSLHSACNNFNAVLKAGKNSGAAFHHTASPGPWNHFFLGMAARRRGIGFSIETAGTPAAVPVHQYGMYELFRENAAGYTWIRSGSTVYRPTELHGAAEYRQALEKLRSGKPAGKSIAAVYDYSGQILDPFNEDILQRSLRRKAGQVLLYLEQAGYDVDLYTDKTENIEWEDFPVVLLLGNRVLDEKRIPELNHFVRSGGTLIQTVHCGEFTPGRSGHRFALAEALGIPPRQTGLFRVGKGMVRVLKSYPDLKKGVGENSRALANGTYPNQLDRMLTASGADRPALQLTGDHIMGIVKKLGDRRIVIFFNNSDFPRSCKFSFTLPEKNYYRYDLVRRMHLSRVSDGRGEISLMPYEITAVEYSPKPIEVPVYDAPLRTRNYVWPDDAYWGVRLAPYIDCSGIVQDGQLLYPVEAGTRLDLPVQVRGLYRVTLVARSSDAVIRFRNGAVLNRVMEVMGFSVYSGKIVMVPQRPLEFTGKNKVVMIGIKPVSRIIRKLIVGKPELLQTGPLYGKQFHAPMPSRIKGVEISADKGYFDFFEHFGMYGVVEVEWSAVEKESRTGLLIVGADYGLRITLNGEEVLNTASMKRGTPRRREIQQLVKLRRGDNRFVARIVCGSGGWRFMPELF